MEKFTKEQREALDLPEYELNLEREQLNSQKDTFYENNTGYYGVNGVMLNVEYKGNYEKRQLLIKVLIGFVSIIILFGAYKMVSLRGVAKQIEYNGVSAKEDPIQTDTTEKEFKKTYGKYDYFITPRAYYKITAKVQSKHHIMPWQDEGAAFSQYDIALAWGELIDSKYDEYIKYSQSGRRYMWRSSYECPLNPSYISEHSANTHTIAANNKVLSGIKDIKKGDVVYLEGYLVDVLSSREKGVFAWDTSLVRNDNSYTGGCEVVYVNKVQIGNKVYE